ncbi:MAG: hypothetical protein LBE37_11375 [Sphingobacterium sp.]|jgi:hypothetical protein|nr:hypothetical protein [Sphingobacterium sp.]
MSLYPTTLFHFTNKQSLYNILNSNFNISYAREKIIGPNNNREFAVPMVSFCDLKLSELKHFLNYGKFGIGLSKEWANRKNLSPVMYINRHCSLMDDLITGLNGIYSHLNLINDLPRFNDLSNHYHNIMNTYRYIKNYEGELIRQGNLTNPNYRFADEREWRFVPKLNTQGVLPFVAISNIKTTEQKEFCNRKVENIKLEFTPEDIKYLVVESESDITDLINHLQNAKRHFNTEIRNKLASRILTSEQIIKDI